MLVYYILDRIPVCCLVHTLVFTSALVVLSVQKKNCSSCCKTTLLLPGTLESAWGRIGTLGNAKNPAAWTGLSSVLFHPPALRFLLQAPQIGIQSGSGDKLAVGSFFCEAALVQHDDFIRVLARLQAMRDRMTVLLLTSSLIACCDVLGQPHPELVQNLERRDVRAHQPDVQREQCPDQSEKSDNAPIHDQLPVDAGRTLRVSEQLLDNFVHRHKRGRFAAGWRGRKRCWQRSTALFSLRRFSTDQTSPTSYSQKQHSFLLKDRSVGTIIIITNI